LSIRLSVVSTAKQKLGISSDNATFGNNKDDLSIFYHHALL